MPGLRRICSIALLAAVSAGMHGCTGISDIHLCNDGIDNDGDGFSDYPEDPGCARLSRADEAPPCNDGLDNDGDQRFDFPLDPGCSSAWDLTELDRTCGLGFELALPALGALRARARRARR